MTFSLAMNAANDLYRGVDGNIATVSGLEAVIQNCKYAMQILRGEVALNTTQGIPYFDTVFSSWNPAQFEVAARAALLAVTDVQAVTAFSVLKVAGIMTYTAEIQTVYGAGTVTNG